VRVGGTSISKTFERQQDAEAFAQLVENDLRRQAAKQKKTRIKAREKDPTLYDFNNEELRVALEKFCKSPEALERHVQSWPTIAKHIGKVKIGEIKTKWVKDYTSRLQGYKTRRGTSFSHTTIAVHLSVMAKACKWLAEQWNLPKPELYFSTKHFPKKWDTRRTRRLSRDEEKLLTQVLRHIDAPSSSQWRCLMKLALETGARLQELLFAEWSEMDLSRHVWTLPAAHTKCDQERVIPLSKRAARYLKFLSKHSSPGSLKIFHRLGNPTSVSAGFHKFVLRAGLEDFRFHDLRHEAISRMVLYKRKLSVFEIMAIVGHSEMSMLLRYANLRGEELADRMD